MGQEKPALTNLRRLSKLPFRVARLAGLWPFIYREDGTLGYKWWSTGVALTAFQLSFYIFLNIWLMIRRETYFGFSSTQLKASRMETIGYALSPLIQTLCICLLYVTTLVNHGSITAVYNHILKVFDELAVIPFCKTVHSATDTMILRASRKAKGIIWFLLLASLVHTFTAATRPFIYIRDNYGPLMAALVSAPIFIWSILQNCNMISSLALLTLVKALEIAYKIMSLMILRAESCPKESAEVSRAEKSDRSGLPLMLVDISRKLDEITEMINTKLKIHLILITLNLLARIIFTVFLFVINVERERLGLHSCGRFFDLILLTVLFYQLCSHGSNLSQAAQEFGHDLGGTSLGMEDLAGFSKVQAESIRLITTPPAISPGDYFTFNNHLVSSIITLLITYSIVLLQFEQEDRKSASAVLYGGVGNTTCCI